MKKLLLLVLLYALHFSVYAISPEDLLAPDEAFQFKASVINENQLKVEWEIAKGYYLYRDRNTFTTDTPDIELGSPEYPPSISKDDPNFGNVEIYYGTASVVIPLIRIASAQQAIELNFKAKYQGCADIGLCYPPIHKQFSLPLSALKTINTTASALNSSVKTNTITLETKPLPPEQAFQYSLQIIDQKTLQASWEVKPEHQIYRDKIQFKLSEEITGITLGEPIFPQGKIVQDEFFGEVAVYDSNFNVTIPINININGTIPASIAIETRYQGCSNRSGICYPVQYKLDTLDLSLLASKKTLAQTSKTTNNTTIATQKQKAPDPFTNKSWWGVLAFFFVVGLGLAFTPCIFPMIPILSGIIAGQGHLSSRKAFLLSLSYILASATAYACIGIVFGYFGENLQAMLQNPITISLFSALFVLLSLSMFGFYELQMPSIIQSRLNEISNRQQSGSFIGAAIMGFLSTLIVGPCTGPVLASALTYLAQTKNALLGGSALFIMGFASGLPLLVVGTSAGHLLPRAGTWMDTTKAIFGIIMLGMAIWMLSRIVAPEIIMVFTGILLIVSGIYMGALDKLQEEMGGWGRFWKSIGLILLLYGTLILLGVSAGSQNLLQPLKGVFGFNVVNPELAVINARPSPTYINNMDELEAVLLEAKTENKITLIDFYADWCVECKRLDKNVFSQTNILRALEDYQWIKADVTQQNADHKILQRTFNIVGPPTIIFIGTDGLELSEYRITGYIEAQPFLEHINRINSEVSK